ncbi:hypothetical protein STEG23_023773, partial [Scotinomys teguina]
MHGMQIHMGPEKAETNKKSRVGSVIAYTEGPLKMTLPPDNRKQSREHNVHIPK